MTETKRAWMAGFVDGEGCLTVSCFMRGHRHRGHAHQYHPVVTVANTQRKALEVFQEAYGGEIEFVVARQKNRQDSWHWRCPAKMVPILLEHLLPYLLLKRPRAELLLELCRLKNARVMV